jgi:peptide-methionine (S)-S-oxide reductase
MAAGYQSSEAGDLNLSTEVKDVVQLLKRCKAMTGKNLTLALTALCVAFICACDAPSRSEPSASAPAADANPKGDPAMKTSVATFGAGCFWGVEATFRKVNGVVDTKVGYTGGHHDNPTYEDLCSHTTGHAEAVRVVFDPNKVSYEELLDVFWKCHNPTTPNRQGVDIGSQYRSLIFYHTPAQKNAAEASKQKLDRSGKYGSKVVTEIAPATTFWMAEEYHQRYLEKRGMRGSHSK